METRYLDFLFRETDSMFAIVSGLEERQMLMASMLARFLHCDSLLDVSQTYSINKDSLYATHDVVTPQRWLRRLMRRGRQRLLKHLLRWHSGDAPFKSRHSMTLCADDFTRTTRGRLGEWTGIFYSGAEKRPVTGLNIEALYAVIGDGQEVLLLDVRLVPPKPKGSGRPPLIHNHWLLRALCGLSDWLESEGTCLEGLSLSVDATYVCPKTVALVKGLKVALVARLSANRKVSGDVDDGPFEALVPDFAGLALFVGGQRVKPLRGEEGVGYQRNTVYAQSLVSDVLMITFIRDREFRVYFTTRLGMKTVTLRNILRYRWQLERVFWVLKQDIGLGDIHNHKGNRVEVRVYLHCILVQIIRDDACEFKCSPPGHRSGDPTIPSSLTPETWLVIGFCIATPFAIGTSRTSSGMRIKVRMGYLDETAVMDRRMKRVAYLEKVIKCNLSKISRALQILRHHAHDLHLVPSLTKYMSFGKGRKLELRFTKNDEPRLEEAYSRHFTLISKINEAKGLKMELKRQRKQADEAQKHEEDAP